ncbi:hypothetical protein FA95DRAFT_1573182 [Auriscalpium vulgare]|uniref:Uncharacterized protein n=1 Tax=Auriscalpium vulgare TaxID=40419 RepID=A0ACB8RR78_9AGAM|nr:hypothetical protein FA95DRAFT_1573182 [Auriscalpium vulgare]
MDSSQIIACFFGRPGAFCLAFTWQFASSQPALARLRLGVCTRSGRILRAPRRMLRTRDDTLVGVATWPRSRASSAQGLWVASRSIASVFEPPATRILEHAFDVADLHHRRKPGLRAGASSSDQRGFESTEFWFARDYQAVKVEQNAQSKFDDEDQFEVACPAHRDRAPPSQEVRAGMPLLCNASGSWTGDASEDNGTPVKTCPTPELKRRRDALPAHRARCILEEDDRPSTAIYHSSRLRELNIKDDDSLHGQRSAYRGWSYKQRTYYSAELGRRSS